MPPYEPLLEEEYRLVFVRSGSRAIWTFRDANGPRLPRIAVQKWNRPAAQLQAAIEVACSIRVILLALLPGRQDSRPCAVAEIMTSQQSINLSAAVLDELPEEELNHEERKDIETILAGDGLTLGPFSRVGWIKEAIEWLRSEFGFHVSFVDDIRQYNASAWFALIRFGTQGGPVCWLKATGAPNAHEFHVTRKLAELCPEFLPPQIAAREDWNAWLMEDAGQPRNSVDLPSLEQAILSMATLQQRTIGQSTDLLAAGAFDQRVRRLRSNLAEVLEYLIEAMSMQTSGKVPRIATERLRQMERILHDACSSFEELDIPDTVIHNDINPGNILFTETRCAFTDWCEVGVGNPFFTFEYLSKLQSNGQEAWTSRLQQTYKGSWLGILNESQIERAFRLTPLLAIFSYLFGRGTWLHSAQRHDPNMQSHARSLARHMDRAAQALELVEAICP
jgi:hypothetical protein